MLWQRVFTYIGHIPSSNWCRTQALSSRTQTWKAEFYDLSQCSWTAKSSVGIPEHPIWETLKDAHLLTAFHHPEKPPENSGFFSSLKFSSRQCILRHCFQKDFREERPRKRTDLLSLVLVILSDCPIDTWHGTKRRVDTWYKQRALAYRIGAKGC